MHVHINMSTYINTFALIHTHVCPYISHTLMCLLFTYLNVNIQTSNIHTHMHTYMHVYMHMYVCMDVWNMCIYVHTCIHVC